MRHPFSLAIMAAILVVSVIGHTTPRGVVNRNLMRLSRILDTPNPTQRTNRLIRELHRNFDYDAFEQKVLVDAASQFTPSQRRRFSAAFRQMFERKIASWASDDSFRCDDYDVSSGPKETAVIVTCLHNNKKDRLTLHFSSVKTTKICDISFSGALLSRNYRGVINKTLRRGSVNALIKKIESKSANAISGQSLL